MDIGTWNWAAGGGRLSLAERWTLTLSALRSRARLKKQHRRHPPEAQRGALDPLDMKALDGIAPPSDVLATAALKAASAVQPEWLTQHALRTYAWGSLLAIQAEAAASPHSRMGLYIRRLGFADLIARAPFDE